MHIQIDFSGLEEVILYRLWNLVLGDLKNSYLVIINDLEIEQEKKDDAYIRYIASVLSESNFHNLGVIEDFALQFLDDISFKKEINVEEYLLDRGITAYIDFLYEFFLKVLNYLNDKKISKTFKLALFSQYLLPYLESEKFIGNDAYFKVGIFS